MEFTDGVENQRMCFNPHMGARFIIAVREDLYKKGYDYNLALSTPSTSLNKLCPLRTQVYNPASENSPKCENIPLSVYNKKNRRYLLNAIAPI
jgi:hypothetical protein